jgi:glycerophosphoryl diester phosphodiesterase
MPEPPIPLLVAHRGYLDRYPENTWPALEAALAAGACWLEFDVQMCADGEFILLHDADFQRTAGCARTVFDMRSDLLGDISVHEPERFGERFAPLAVPVLGDVLQRLAAFPGARAMVEIKTESLQHWGLEKVMDALLQQLDAFRDRCVLISFDPAALAYAQRKRAPDIGWVLTRYDAVHLQQARRLQPHYLICNETKLPAGDKPWPGDWQWMLYDIRDPEAALAWAQRGVELIETAAIGTLLAHPVLARRACRHGI